LVSRDSSLFLFFFSFAFPMPAPRSAAAANAEGAERVLALRKLGGGWQYQIQWRGQQETTWEAASRVRKEVPQLVQEFEQRQQQLQQPEQQSPQQPAAPEGATDDEMAPAEAVGAQPGGGAAAETAALQRQVAELALLVKQQAQRAEEQQQHARQQQSLIEQLRASAAHSPQHSAPVSPRNERASPKRSLALHESSRAAAVAVQEHAATASGSLSRFARKEPRAQDLQEYDGASGAKLDDWLKQLAMTTRLYHLTAQEAVDFAGSRLRGAALDWWLALGDSELAAIADREALAAALRARFQPITAARTAREQLDKLQQGGRGINEYIADFQRLTTQIGMSSLGQENALYAFERGLRRELAVELRKQGVATLQEAIALTARVGGLMQSSAAPQSRQSLSQMDVDDGGDEQPPKGVWQALLNAMQSQGSSDMGAKTQTQRGYSQEREQRGGGRGGRGGQSGGRGGRFGMRSGPPVVPGVPESVVRERWHAQQCLRCGQGGHQRHACPNAISASGN
jgi:hypothetical protein